jgi:hypothetical protein
LFESGEAAAVPGHVDSIVIAEHDPAIHPSRKRMDARLNEVRADFAGGVPGPAHDGGEQRLNWSGLFRQIAKAICRKMTDFDDMSQDEQHSLR